MRLLCLPVLSAGRDLNLQLVEYREMHTPGVREMYPGGYGGYRSRF